MLKKMYFIFVALVLLSVLFVSVYADDLSESSEALDDNAVYVPEHTTNSVDPTTSAPASDTAEELIYTIDSEGNITQSVYVPSNNQRASSEGVELSADEYLPTAIPESPVRIRMGVFK